MALRLRAEPRDRAEVRDPVSDPYAPGEKYKLLEARWVTTEEGVPPRHTYRLTPNGYEFAQTQFAEARARAGWLGSPELSRG